MDLLSALDVATLTFATRVDAVCDDQWGSPTPCEDWDVRYLVAHVVGGNRFAALVLGGESCEAAVGQVMSRPQLGATPADDVASSARAQRTAFRAAGRLDAVVDHPAGTMTARRFLGFRVFDLALHTWDLAVAVAADTTLHPALVETVLDITSAEPAGMASGIRALGQVGPDAPAQDRLLDLAGRRASAGR